MSKRRIGVFFWQHHLVSVAFSLETHVTVALGRENSLGYEYTWKNSMHGLRLEFNWQEPRSENTMFDGALYGERTRYQSVGAYYVISPFENGFRVMTGWRFNDIKTTYAVNAGGLANVK